MTRTKVLVGCLVAGVVQFGLAIIVFGGWTAFSNHPALIYSYAGHLRCHRRIVPLSCVCSPFGWQLGMILSWRRPRFLPRA